MFVALLGVTFAIAGLVTVVVARLFDEPVRQILSRVVGDISEAWHRYVTFAIYVVGISGGVRIFELEKYITAQGKEHPQIVLSRDRWILEVYRTVIETLQSTAWMLLVFFIIGLVAYCVVRIAGVRRSEAIPAARGTTQTGMAG